MLQQANIITGLFSIVGIRKQDEVLGACRRGGQFRARGQQRGVGVDAAALAFDAAYRANHASPLVADSGQRDDRMRRRIHGVHRHLIHRPQQIDGRAGAFVGQIHLGFSWACRGGHRAAAIHGDDHRH